MRDETLEGLSDPKGGELVKRHRFATRVWHWVNALAVVVMLMSGMMISNAHAMLYWGEFGANFDQPWLRLPTFPGWATIPSSYNLAVGRMWHLAFAWILAVGLLVYLVISLFNRHIVRDLRLRASELAPRHLLADIVHHIKLQFPTGAAALKYNTLQKITYIGVIFVLLPLLILTGMTLSPGLAPVTAWFVDLVGGRQTARSIHFLAATGIALFIVVHLVLVVLAGPYNEVRSMITGKFRIPPDRKQAAHEELAGEPA